jgi:hypothetical protein
MGRMDPASKRKCFRTVQFVHLGATELQPDDSKEKPLTRSRARIYRFGGSYTKLIGYRQIRAHALCRFKRKRGACETINSMTNRPGLGLRFRLGAMATLIIAIPALAQQDQAAAPRPARSSGLALPSQAAQPSQQGQADQDDKEKSKQHKTPEEKAETAAPATSNDRLFFALPNFLTLENADQVPPLTTKQKFAVVTRSSFDYIQVPWYAFLAGISQAENSEPGYGQGAAGYGKRFGAAAADGTIENYWTSAILPSVFHQDPRFFQSGKGGFWRRTGYAMSRIVVTRSDSGSSQFNVSEVFGSAIAAGISTYSYHPHADKTLSNTASVWGSQIGYDTVTIVLKEFWPDIRRKLTHKQSEPVTP